VVLAVRRALAEAGLDTGQVALVSAHGTGTPVNDAVEAASLAELFPPTPAGTAPLVFGTKGALGHSLGATGAIEAITVILALRDGVAPPIANLTSPLPDFPLPLARPGATAWDRAAGTAGISLTLGFGGFNTCLLFTAPEEP
jgi:3-oxoacyl-[acyl-carrier-protein] synthase II